MPERCAAATVVRAARRSNLITKIERTPSIETRRRAQVVVAGAISAAVVLWASAFVAIRAALRGYAPAHVAALRYIVGSSLFAALACARKLRIPDRRDWPRLVLTGVTGFSAYALLLNAGEVRVAAGPASFVVNTVPMFTALLATLFLGERLGRRGWLGLAVSMGGTAILAFGTMPEVRFEPAVLILLAAAVSQAIYFVLQKPLVARYGAVSVTSWALWVGTALLLPFLPAALRVAASAPRAATLAALYLGALPTVVGYGAWAYAVSRRPVGRTTAWLYCIPVVATLIGWALLGERPTALGVLGGGIAIGGVALAALLPSLRRET